MVSFLALVVSAGVTVRQLARLRHSNLLPVALDLFREFRTAQFRDHVQRRRDPHYALSFEHLAALCIRTPPGELNRRLRLERVPRRSRRGRDPAAGPDRADHREVLPGQGHPGPEGAETGIDLRVSGPEFATAMTTDARQGKVLARVLGDKWVTGAEKDQSFADLGKLAGK